MLGIVGTMQTNRIIIVQTISAYLNLPVRTYKEACRQVDWKRLEAIRVKRQIDKSHNVVKISKRRQGT